MVSRSSPEPRTESEKQVVRILEANRLLLVAAQVYLASLERHPVLVGVW